VIYFMRITEGGTIKIGHSADVERRRKDLENFYGCPLEVLAILEGGQTEEKQLHARFAKFRCGRTEQFRPDEELLKFIGASLEDGAKTEHVPPRKPQRYRYVITATPEHIVWMREFMKHIGELDISDVIRESLRRLAATDGFSQPPKW
jgi:hypothetical protein